MAEDVWAETSTIAARRVYQTLRPDSNVRGWLVTIAHRKALRPAPEELHALPRPPPTFPSVLSNLGIPDPGRRPSSSSALAALPLQAACRGRVPPRRRALPYAEVGASSTRALPPHVVAPPTVSPSCARRTREERHRDPPHSRTTYTVDDLLATIPSLDLDGEGPNARAARRCRRAGRTCSTWSYRTVDSPVGPLLLAGAPGRAGAGRVRCGEGHDAVLHRLAEQISPRITVTPRRLEGPRHPARRVLHRASVTLFRPGDRHAARPRLPPHRPASTSSTFVYGVHGELRGGSRRRGGDQLAGTAPTALACATNPLPLRRPLPSRRAKRRHDRELRGRHRRQALIARVLEAQASS